MGKRGPKPNPATRRTFLVVATFQPHVKEDILKAIEKWKMIQSMKGRDPKEITISEFVREAVWEKCRRADDPRKP